MNKDLFDKLVSSIEPHLNKGQVLVAVGQGETIEKALKIAGIMATETDKYRIIEKDTMSCLLIYLSEIDTREMVIKLIEGGYSKVVGIDPRSE